MSVKDFLSKQSNEALSCSQMLVGVHLILGHSVDVISEQTDISRVKVSQIASFLQAEGLLEITLNVEPIKQQSASRLGSFVETTLNNTKPKTARKAINTKPRPKATNLKSKSPLEINVDQWLPKHVLDYFTILWCEQGWKTPPPRWQVKDRANAKRLQETYGEDIKKIIDFLFSNWSNLQSQFNIQGLPSISILWGFRDSIVPQALGDATGSKKNWGSSHDNSQDRDDGDEVGW
jgi:hypothetical protein